MSVNNSEYPPEKKHTSMLMPLNRKAQKHYKKIYMNSCMKIKKYFVTLQPITSTHS